MDQEEFIKRLAQFAELKEIKPPKTAGRREASEEEIIERNGKILVLDKDTNPTLTYEVKKLKNSARACDYCDQKVKDQVISKRWLNFPKGHWRESCNSCKMTKNPETGCFDIKDIAAPAFFASYFYHRNK